jgi:hypothetical protein
MEPQVFKTSIWIGWPDRDRGWYGHDPISRQTDVEITFQMSPIHGGIEVLDTMIRRPLNGFISMPILWELVPHSQEKEWDKQMVAQWEEASREVVA